MAIDTPQEIEQKPVETGRKKHRSHPRLVVFFVCLVISVLMWFFIELMKDYTDELKYSISFTNTPKDLILTNSEDTLIRIGMHAQGFELLAAKYSPQKGALTIDLSSVKVRPSGEGFEAYLPSSKIIEQLGPQIRFKTDIAYIKPDTLFFEFSKVFRKQVPVKPDLSYTLNAKYDITDSIICSPSSVTVSSIKSIIDTLSFIQTDRLNFKDVDSSINIKTKLMKGKYANLLRFSNDSVTVHFKVEQVTEAGYKVPVTVVGNGKSVKVYPDNVEVLCRVPLTLYPHLEASNFVAQAEYKPSMVNEKRLRVVLTKMPERIRVLKIIPAEVEYIIISK